jgi:Sec-independent protein translocase protein TatA
MLGISVWELSVIFIISVLIIPVNDWPKVIKMGSKIYRNIQKLYVKLLRELNLMDLD